MRVLPAFAPALALVMVTAAPAFSDPTRQITVTGQGEVRVAPDLARISVGVRADGKTAAEALAGMNSGARAVLDRLLTEEQVDSNDVQTGQLFVGPRHDTRAESDEPTGYTASTTVDLTVRDLTRLGGLLDALVGDGANSLGGLSFDLADSTDAMNDARRAAIADGAARAALYAEAAGVTLGPVLSITEGGGSGPMPYMALEMARAGAVPVAEGQVSLSASVTMVYEIEQP